jgi:16S rRNA processing protein RimM
VPSAGPDRVLLGRIVGAHGIRGEVMIKTYTAAPEDVAAYGALCDAAGRTFNIERTQATPKGVIARLAGVRDRNAAEALKGTELFVRREQLPLPAEGEFYHADLIGLSAVAPDGAVIGDIVGVHNFGAGDIIEVRLPDGRKTALIPFTESHVPAIDLAARSVVVIMPAEDADADPGEA